MQAMAQDKGGSGLSLAVLLTCGLLMLCTIAGGLAVWQSSRKRGGG